MNRSPRIILLVDNNESVLNAVRLRLQTHGYEVLAAGDKAAALQLLAESIFHLAVVDLRLEDEKFRGDMSGFDVARNLPKDVPCIVYTAYEEKETIKQALGEIGAYAIIDKTEENASNELIGTVAQAFAEQVKVNFDLEIQARPSLDALAMQIDLPGDGDELPPTSEDIRLILQRLFLEANRLQITPLLSPEEAPTMSQSGAVILKVQEQRASGTPVPVVLKLAGRQEIRDEAQRYAAIKPYLGGQLLAQLQGEACSRSIGGLVYSLVGAQNLRSLRTLAEVFFEIPTHALAALLDRFFATTFAGIYRDSQMKLLNLTEHHTMNLRLTPEKLEVAVRSFYPEALADPTVIRLPGVADPLPNPITWAMSQGAFRTFDSMRAGVCLCHGDLHTRNILVDDENRCWLVDFARSQPSHVLRDPAELETDIKFHVLPGENLALLLQFERALLTPTKWQEPVPAGQFSPSLDHAFAIIARLRQVAGALAPHHPNDDLQEYYQVLFWHTLNVIRLRYVSLERKQHALLAAALLVERLHDWPRWPRRPLSINPDAVC